MDDLTFKNGYPCYKGLPLEDAEIQEITNAVGDMATAFTNFIIRTCEAFKPIAEAFKKSIEIFLIEPKYETERFIQLHTPKYWIRNRYRSECVAHGASPLINW